MKCIKNLIILNLLMISGSLSFAQQKTFYIATYTAPKGWTEQKNESNISYSKIDGSSWGQIVIYAHRNCEGNIQTDFTKDWDELVAAGKSISSPEKTEPKNADGWKVLSGSGTWQYNGSKVTSMLTVYSNDTICVALLCNITAMPYLKEYQLTLGTIDFDITKISKESNSSNTSSKNQTNNLSVVGTWDQYVNERGTSGYFRSEYVIKADGTYLFLRKNCSAIGDEINFNYETGVWKLNGNQLTIFPKQGKDEVLEKPASGHWGTDWGKLLKSNTRILETATYTIRLSYDEYYKTNYLEIKFNKPTQRDGGSRSVVFHKYDEPYITLPHKLPT